MHFSLLPRPHTDSLSLRPPQGADPRFQGKKIQKPQPETPSNWSAPSHFYTTDPDMMILFEKWNRLHFDFRSKGQVDTLFEVLSLYQHVGLWPLPPGKQSEKTAEFIINLIGEGLSHHQFFYKKFPLSHADATALKSTLLPLLGKGTEYPKPVYEAVLKKTLSLAAHKVVEAKEMGPYMVQLLPLAAELYKHQSLDRFERFTWAIDHERPETAFKPEHLTMFAQIIRDYAALLEHPKGLEPLLYVINDLLPNRPSDQWQNLLEGFAQAMAKASPSVCANVGPNSPGRALLNAAFVGAMEPHCQDSLSTWAATLFEQYALLEKEAPNPQWAKTLADMALECKSPSYLKEDMLALHQKFHDRPQAWQHYPTIRNILAPHHQDDSKALEMMIDLVFEQPGKWEETAQAICYFKHIDSQLEDSPTQQTLMTNLRFLAKMHFPTPLLNNFLQHRDEISVQTLFQLYNTVEYQLPKEDGKNLLPELLALLAPYNDMARAYAEGDEDIYIKFLEQATAGITRLYDFIGSSDSTPGIAEIDSLAYKNWSHIGSLGLSFTKWQYDAMRLWKSAGPQERPPLLEQSGLFTSLAPRENDSKYFGGFLHRNPVTGLSIELRRAYIVISQPGLGTLVIRNSSPVFGRDLLPEPAYFSPHVIDPQGNQLFNPDTDLEAFSFVNVLDKPMHQPNYAHHTPHEKIESLLTAFDQTMDRYVEWKCGFQKGKPPQGLAMMVKASLDSAPNRGSSSPFGKRNNIHLAWAHPYQVPNPLQKFDISIPAHQQELALLWQLLSHPKPNLSWKDYEPQLPNILPFLAQGARNGWELIFAE